MIGGVPNPVASPNQILLVEVMQPQKLGEGDGRIPYEKIDGLGSYHPGGFMVGYRNGAVGWLSAITKPLKN
jgi:hypothetical protein